MLTEWDKALVAAILGVVSLLSLWLGWDTGWLSEQHVVAAVAILTPILVWFVPNRPVLAGLEKLRR